MKPIKCIQVYILVVVLITSILAGCANDNDNDHGGETIGTTVSDADLSGLVFVPEIIPFPVLNEGNTDFLEENVIFLIIVVSCVTISKLYCLVANACATTSYTCIYILHICR